MVSTDKEWDICDVKLEHNATVSPLRQMTCEKYASSCRLLFIILKIPYLKSLYIILIIFSLLTSFVPIHVNSSLKNK